MEIGFFFFLQVNSANGFHVHVWLCDMSDIILQSIITKSETTTTLLN